MWKYGYGEIQNVLTIPFICVNFLSNELFIQAQRTLADQANKPLFVSYKG